MGVIQLGDFLRFGCTAGSTGIGANAGFFLGRFFSDLACIPAVTQSSNHFLFGQHRIAAVAMLAIAQTFFRAGGGVALIGHFVVAQSSHFITVIGIPANIAGVGSVALFCAGRRNNSSGIIMVAAADIVGLGHGVGCVECGRIVVVLRGHLAGSIPAVVVVKVIGAHQEALIDRKTRIPGGVQIIVLAVQLGDVPNMTLAVGIAGDHTAVHTQFQRQPVQQHRIALADRGLIDQSGIGGMLQLIAVILEIIVVVSNVGGDIVVNRFKLGIAVLTGHIQLAQQLRNGRIHRCLLGCIGMIGHGEGGGCSHILTAHGKITVVHIEAGVLPQQIVAFHRIAGVLHGAGHNVKNQGLHILLDGIGIVGEGNIDRNGGIPGHQIIPDHFAGGFGIIILAVNRIISIKKGLSGLHQIPLGNDICIQRIYIGKPHAFRQGMRFGKHAYGKQREQHTQHQTQADHTFHGFHFDPFFRLKSIRI